MVSVTDTVCGSYERIYARRHLQQLELMLLKQYMVILYGKHRPLWFPVLWLE